MNIEVFHEQKQEVFDALVSGVRYYNQEHMGEEKSKPLMLVVRDNEGRLIAGVAGRTIYFQLLIEVLWVDRKKRGEGLGTKLMKQLEAEAKKRGCIAAQVDTLSFQAPDFYKRLGFKIVGKVCGIKNSPDRYFLLKEFDCF